jgi:signal transduction histidine kinase
VVAEISLSDKTWLRFATPLLTVTPFSLSKIGPPLAAMVASVLLIAAWVLHRSAQPLTQFAAAAERFGTDVHAPPLAERGPYEVRTAAHTFNLMQERILRLVEDRTALAAAIAHDLGTPITRLQLRAHEIEDERMRDQVLADLEQMRRMITATLAFARSDVTIEGTSTFDLASLIQSLCDDLADLGHEVAVDGPARLTVNSKPLGLRRVLSNLIENAIKYGGRARIAFADSNKSIEIRIDDDGPGIPDHLKEEAFKPFRRLLAPGSPVEGTGLGLTIARSIARALGGDVALSDRSTKGLRATVVLPKRLRGRSTMSRVARETRHQERMSS